MSVIHARVYTIIIHTYAGILNYWYDVHLQNIFINFFLLKLFNYSKVYVCNTLQKKKKFLTNWVMKINMCSYRYHIYIFFSSVFQVNIYFVHAMKKINYYYTLHAHVGFVYAKHWNSNAQNFLHKFNAKNSSEQKKKNKNYILSSRIVIPSFLNAVLVSRTHRYAADIFLLCVSLVE